MLTPTPSFLLWSKRSVLVADWAVGSVSYTGSVLDVNNQAWNEFTRSGQIEHFGWETVCDGSSTSREFQ